MLRDTTPVRELPETLRALELFAGIGGWRLALKAALPKHVNVDISAYDSGPHCSEIYARNFGEPCCRRNIEQLRDPAFEGFDLWMMSPPCQPFSTTNEAKQLGLADRRCAALSHLCSVLPRLTKPPRWIVLENVKGFYDSDACHRWCGALEHAGYSKRQLLLDLAAFGVPNHRTRYYLLAERSHRFDACVSATTPNPVQVTCPAVSSVPADSCVCASARSSAVKRDSCGRPRDVMVTDEAAKAANASTGCAISVFLENLSQAELEELMISKAVLEKPFAKGLSFVRPCDPMSFCFTGHYGKVMHKSSGSLLYTPRNGQDLIDRDSLPACHGSVRLFSPKEILNMFGFPAPYSLPGSGEMALRHRFKAVGNSIAVSVGTELLRLLLHDEGSERLSELEQAPPAAQLRPRGTEATVDVPPLVAEMHRPVEDEGDVLAAVATA